MDFMPIFRKPRTRKHTHCEDKSISVKHFSAQLMHYP